LDLCSLHGVDEAVRKRAPTEILRSLAGVLQTVGDIYVTEDLWEPKDLAKGYTVRTTLWKERPSIHRSYVWDNSTIARTRVVLNWDQVIGQHAPYILRGILGLQEVDSVCDDESILSLHKQPDLTHYCSETRLYLMKKA
jgi:hypothetical protein